MLIIVLLVVLLVSAIFESANHPEKDIPSSVMDGVKSLFSAFKKVIINTKSKSESNKKKKVQKTSEDKADSSVDGDEK